MEIVEATDAAWRGLQQKHGEAAGDMVVVTLTFAELSLIEAALLGVAAKTRLIVWKGSYSEKLLGEVSELVKSRWDAH